MYAHDEEKQVIFASLKDALLQLMNKKDFSKITVKEIVIKAGIGRSTFYRHFPNKLDLIRYLINDALVEFDKKYAPKAIEDRFEAPYMNEVQNYVHNHRNQIRSLYQSGLSYLYLEELNKHLIHLKPYTLTIEEKIYLYGLAGAQYNIIFNGFIDNINKSVDTH